MKGFFISCRNTGGSEYIFALTPKPALSPELCFAAVPIWTTAGHTRGELLSMKGRNKLGCCVPYNQVQVAVFFSREQVAKAHQVAKDSIVAGNPPGLLLETLKILGWDGESKDGCLLTKEISPSSFTQPLPKVARWVNHAI